MPHVRCRVTEQMLVKYLGLNQRCTSSMSWTQMTKEEG